MPDIINCYFLYHTDQRHCSFCSVFYSHGVYTVKVSPPSFPSLRTLQPVNKQDVLSRWNTRTFLWEFFRPGKKTTGRYSNCKHNSDVLFCSPAFLPRKYSAPDTSEAHTLFYSLEKWKLCGGEGRAWRRAEREGSERQREETGQKSEIFREQRKTARDGVTQSQTGSWWVFWGVLLRQVILMKHDILFWWERWLAMQKLTDGQEIQYWNEIRQKSFFGGKWGEKKLESSPIWGAKCWGRSGERQGA